MTVLSWIKEAPHNFFLMKILDIFYINVKIRTNRNRKCRKKWGLRPSFRDVLRGKMRVKLVNLYAFHMRKCIFLGFSDFSRWKVVVFFLFADGTHMFVKMRQKIQVFQTYFFWYMLFYASRSGCRTVVLFTAPLNIIFLKLSPTFEVDQSTLTFWQMKCQWKSVHYLVNRLRKYFQQDF